MEKEQAKQILESRYISIEDENLNTFINDKEVFEALLVMGANPNYVFYDVWGQESNILGKVVYNTLFNQFKLLLKYGANPNSVSIIQRKKSPDDIKAEEKENIMFDIVANAGWRFFQEILKYDVNLNVLSPLYGDTLLIYVLRRKCIYHNGKHKQTVELMLKHGVNVNQKNVNNISIFDLIERPTSATSEFDARATNKFEVDDDIFSLLEEYKDDE
jgi:hypothetical protein